MNRPPLDRIRGILWGAALGDALGAPYEFQKAPVEVDTEHFGKGYFGTEPGHPTDDSTLVLLLARALATSMNWAQAKRAYVQSLVDWLASSPPDVGGQTRSALMSWRDRGRPPRRNDSAQGNGSLMAIGPLAAVNAPPSIVRDFTVITHPSTACQNVNTAYVRHAAGLCFWDGDPATLPFHGYEMSTAVQVDGAAMGWCKVATTLAHLAVEETATKEHATPFDALVWVLQLGGDTDTNGAVAGALLGAAFGTDWMPGHLIADLALAPELDELAVALHASWGSF